MKLHFNCPNLPPFLEINILTKEHDSKQAGLLGSSGGHMAVPRSLWHTRPTQHASYRVPLQRRSCHIPFPGRQKMLHPTCAMTEPTWVSQMLTASPATSQLQCHVPNGDRPMGPSLPPARLTKLGACPDSQAKY